MIRFVALSVIAATVGGIVGCAFAVYRGAPAYWIVGIPTCAILGFFVATNIYERWGDR